MADNIQIILEDMVPELEEWVKKELFSKAEVKAIIKKRTFFEYRLKRKPPEKIDFLRYIEYETNLEKLRKKRRKKQAAKLQEEDKKLKINFSFAGIQRLHRIYNRTLKRFPGDIELWKRYFQFCKDQKSSKMLNKIFARAIQNNPTVTDFWIIAAKYEYFKNRNITGSRALFQRALRLLHSDQSLWINYFHVELVYITHIYDAAKNLAKEEEDTDMKDTDLIKDEKDEINDLVEKLPEEKELSSNSQIDIITKAKEATYALGAIPKVVFKNAIKEFPKDVRFRKLFLESCDKSRRKIQKKLENPDEIKSTDEIIDQIYSHILKSLIEDFPNDPQALSIYALASHKSLETITSLNRLSEDEERESCLSKISAFETSDVLDQFTLVSDLFHDHFNKNPNSQLCEEYVILCSNLLSSLKQVDKSEMSDSFEVSPVIDQITSSLLEACKNRFKYATERIIEEWVNVLLHCGQFKQAIDVLESVLKPSVSSSSSPNIPFSVKLWMMRIELTIKFKYSLGIAVDADKSVSTGKENINGIIDPSIMHLYNLCLDLCLKSKSKTKNVDIRFIWNHLFKYYFDLLTQYSNDAKLDVFNNFLTLYKKALKMDSETSIGAIVSQSSDSYNLREIVLDQVRLHFGITSTRTIYKYSLTVSSKEDKLKYLWKCIHLEKLELEIANEKEKQTIHTNIRNLYNSIIDICGSSNEELWLDLIDWEKKHGTNEKGNKIQEIYQKARKTLTNPTSFISRCSLLMGT